MVFPCRLRGFGRCCAALLAWLLGLVALPAIGPELPTPDGAVVVILPADLEELPAQRQAELIAHPSQAPPAVLEAIAASSFSQPQPTVIAVGIVVSGELRLLGIAVYSAEYVGTSDPVNRWDPTGLDWEWVDPPGEPGEWRWVPGEGEIDYNERPGIDPPEWSKPVFNGRRNGQRIATANAIAGRFQDFGLSRGTMVLAEGVGKGTIAHWPAEVAANISGFVNRTEGITTLDGALTAFNAEIDRIAAEIRRRNEEAAVPQVRFATERIDDAGRFVLNEAHATALDTLFLDGDAVRGEFVGGDLPQEDIESLRTAAVILSLTTPAGIKNQAQRQARRQIRSHIDDAVDASEDVADASRRAAQRGPNGTAFNPRFWNRQTTFRGNKVYQRNDLIDPTLRDARGRTNVERMQRGLAPVGPDGKSLQLHHVTQQQNGGIAEMTATFHQQNFRTIHINTGKLPSGIDRRAFNQWRTQYWQNRALDFGGGP